MNYPHITSAIDTHLARLREVRELLTPANSAEPSKLDETIMKLTLEKLANPAGNSKPAAPRGQVLAMTRSNAPLRAANTDETSAVAVLDHSEADSAEYVFVPLENARHLARRGSRRSAPVVSSALGGARPVGPVFVPAAVVAAARPVRTAGARTPASRTQPAKPAAMKPREGTLDAMLRDYARSRQDAAKDPQRAYDLQSFGM